MSWYRQIDVRIHGDEKFLRLTPELPSGRALFKHLLICPENGPLPGVIRAGAAALAEALEWLPERFRERFGELLREGLAEADWKARLVFLPNGIRYNPPNNPNVVAGWSKHWDALPEGPLKVRIWHRYHAFFVEDKRRREEEQQGEVPGKKLPPEALLVAFLRAMPEPSSPPSETVTLTVPGTVPGTVTPTVAAYSAGARARLPEPEQEPEQDTRTGKEEGSAEGNRRPPEAPPAPASGARPRRTKAPRFDPRTVPIPPELDSPAFRTAWEERIVERGEPGASGGKPSESQIRAQLRKLVKLAKARGLPLAIGCVERATEGRHQGIVWPEDFEERGRNGSPHSLPPRPAPTPPTLARLHELACARVQDAGYAKPEAVRLFDKIAELKEPAEVRSFLRELHLPPISELGA